MTVVLAPALAFVKVDAGQIQQVLMNLAANARDAMPQGGQLNVETCDVTVDDNYHQAHLEVQPGAYSMLSVTDTGMGMNEATKARIFEPFFTTKELGQGTGLGMAVVHGIVKQSGGHIEVYSEIGRGSAFKVYLPQVKDASPSDESSSLVRTMPTGSETLLLVEDDDAVRAFARHVLVSCGYTLLEASDGLEAIRLAQTHEGSIHLVVTDVVMPHLDGHQLAERLAAIRPGLKMLFVSGYTNDAIIRHGIIEANVAFLQKPFTPSALARKVRTMLDDTK
jgi:CheY-like chemotaxis protein